jgi:hypothetical protein
VGRTALMIGLVALSGCAADERWEQFAAGPPLKQAQAYCENVMLTTGGGGTYAAGSTAFVIGATLAGAVADGITRGQIYRNCMTMQGWQHAPEPKSKKPT